MPRRYLRRFFSTLLVALLLASYPTAGIKAATPAPVGDARTKTFVANPGVYVAIGASDSYGVGAADPATQSWPAVLAGFLPLTTKFVNLGVPGITLHRAVLTEGPIALDAHPGLVTIFLAVNDIVGGVALSSYRDDLNALLDALQRRTKARVLLANLPDLTLVSALSGRPGLGTMVAYWNGVIAAAARAHGDILVDLHAHWRELAAHPEYVGADGLHPTAEGYRRLAAIFWQTYRAALSR